MPYTHTQCCTCQRVYTVYRKVGNWNNIKSKFNATEIKIKSTKKTTTTKCEDSGNEKIRKIMANFFVAFLCMTLCARYILLMFWNNYNNMYKYYYLLSLLFMEWIVVIVHRISFIYDLAIGTTTLSVCVCRTFFSVSVSVSVLCKRNILLIRVTACVCMW